MESYLAIEFTKEDVIFKTTSRAAVPRFKPGNISSLLSLFSLFSFFHFYHY